MTIQGRWARTWLAWLQEYHPEKHRTLVANGKLGREAERFERRCQETYNQVLSDLRRGNPGPTPYLQAVQHLMNLQAMAAEQVLHDLLPYPGAD